MPERPNDPTPDERRPYRTPRLAVYGDLRVLTRSTTRPQTMNDMGSGGPFKT
jgi:hypothetical protein